MKLTNNEEKLLKEWKKNIKRDYIWILKRQGLPKDDGYKEWASWKISEIVDKLKKFSKSA